MLKLKKWKRIWYRMGPSSSDFVAEKIRKETLSDNVHKNEQVVNLDVEKNELFPVVRIGQQLWMAEDLDVPIADGKGYCLMLPGLGRLYNWEAALSLCPDGWRLPSDEDWVKLECALGMPEREAHLRVWGWRNGGSIGLRLKEQGDSRLNMSLKGYCTAFGILHEQGNSGWWWSSTLNGTENAVTRGLNKSEQGFRRTYNRKDGGRSVRYVKDFKPEQVRLKKI